MSVASRQGTWQLSAGKWFGLGPGIAVARLESQVSLRHACFLANCLFVCLFACLLACLFVWLVDWFVCLCVCVCRVSLRRGGEEEGLEGGGRGGKKLPLLGGQGRRTAPPTSISELQIPIFTRARIQRHVPYLNHFLGYLSDESDVNIHFSRAHPFVLPGTSCCIS